MLNVSILLISVTSTVRRLVSGTLPPPWLMRPALSPMLDDITAGRRDG